MSSNATSGGLLKRKKAKAPRSYDAQVNLVPFIDLLSVLICFMLISAAWLQLAKLDANLPTTGAGAAAEAAAAEEEKFQLQVLLTKDKIIKIDRGSGLEDLPSADSPDGKVFDWTKFDAILKEVRIAHPENKDVILSADPDLEYQDVISAMDVCIANKLPNVSLAASAAKGAEMQ